MKRGVNLDIHIHIEKRHFVIILAFISLLGIIVIGSAGSFNPDLPYHPLQQVSLNSTDKTSVDQDGNKRIDKADKSYGLDAESDVVMNNNRITDLQNPANAQDAATKDYVDDNASVPSGVIVMWSGNITDIPSGWALCDGTDGTPDLTNRFVMGVPDSSTDPGATGGTNTYSLSTSQLPSHSHDINSDGEHTHTYEDRRGAEGKYTWRSYGNGPQQEYETSAAGSHDHGGSTQNTGSGASIDNRPEYYQLAYIMKL